jgi:hypothetical protein
MWMNRFRPAAGGIVLPVTEGPARPDPRAVAAVLGALVVGGVVGTLLAGFWLRSGPADSGPSVPLFVVAASKVSLRQGTSGDTVFGGSLTVMNPGRLPIAVSKVNGELSGVTITGEESPPRNIPVGGQNLVSVTVSVPKSQCSASRTDSVFPEPIPLTVTLTGASQPVKTSLELAGTGWDQIVRERCTSGR